MTASGSAHQCFTYATVVAYAVLHRCVPLANIDRANVATAQGTDSNVILA